MELRLAIPSLVVLIGPSGSGKSTWAAEHFAANEIVSSDALRGMVGAGEDDQTASTAAFEILERIVGERLSRGSTTVIDTLGYDADSRRRWIELAHEAGLTAHAVLFPTSGEVCEARNEGRPRPLPKRVIRRQVSRFPKVRAEVETEPFDVVHETRPATLVASPMITSHGEAGAGTRAPENAGVHSFGLMVSRFDWADNDLAGGLAAIANRAERAGFRDLWIMDHFRQIRAVGRPWEDIPEAYTTLGFVAGITSTIRLGALVTGITHRQPVVLGKAVATLDVLSGGRANCGLGVAWDDEEHRAYGIDFPDLAVRYEVLEETLQMLPLLWGKGSPEFRGEHIDADELICYPRPLQDAIPILVGGSGERRTLRIAARYADACNVFGDPERVRHKTTVLHRHCEEVGRDPATVEVTHLTNALVAADRASLRKRVETLRDRNTAAERYMARNHAGTVEDLAELFAAYHEAGAAHSIVSLPDVAHEGAVETFADVIAALAPT